MNKISIVKDIIASDNFRDFIDIIDDKIIVKNSSLIIDYIDCHKEYKFLIEEDCEFFEYYENSNISNIYNVECFKKFNLNRFSNDCSISTIINLDEESSLIYNYSTLNKKDNKYVININHNGKNSISSVVNHGINLEDNKLDFIINSNILKESYNVLTSQDSKIIIMKNNNCSIKPNLIVDNNDISATHAAYIGRFRDDEIFYLMSRGINEEESKKIIAKAFLLCYKKIDDACYNKVIQALDDNWRS